MPDPTLHQVLNPDVRVVAPQTPLAEVWRVMEERRISCVAVMDAERPVGIFTERDSVNLMARGGWAADQPIREHMQTPVLADNLGMDIYRAYQLMASHNVRQLLVVDGEGHLLGLVTEGDLLHSIGLEQLLQPKVVANAMTTRVVSLNVDDTLRDAARRMSERNLSCILVLADNTPAGILTERDMVRLLRAGDPSTRPLGEVMSQPLVTIQADDLLAVAMQRMEAAGIRRMVVMDDQSQLAGLLTRHDVVKALQAHYVELLQDTVERLRGDLKKAANRLETAEHRLLESSVMSQVNDAVLVVTIADGRVVEANDAACDLLGMGLEELLGRFCTDFVEACGDEKDWQTWAEDFVARGLMTEETRCRRRDGRWFPADISLRHVTAARGAFLVAVLRDITRHKMAEQRIRLDREQQCALREILEIGIAEGDLKSRLERCLDRLLAVSWLTLLPKGGVFLMEAGRLRLVADRNFSPEIRASCAQVALGQCLCGRAAAEGQVQYAHCVDQRHDIRYPGMTEHGHYSLPLKAGGEVLGVLVLYLPHDHPQVAEEQEFLEAVAGALAGVLRRERIEQAYINKEAEIHLLLDSTAEAIFGVDMEGRCTFVNRACLEILGYDASDDLLGQPIHELIHHHRADGREYPPEECLALPRDNPINRRHVDDEVFWRRDGTAIPVEYWSHPVFRNGQQAGAVVTFIDIRQRKETEARLEHQAHHDALTGLPNRALFQARLDHAINIAKRYKQNLALLFLDLDGFKHVNDSLGHPAGDELLQAIAVRLSRNLRAVDTLARLGGDEFVVLLEELDSINEAAVVAQNLLELLRQPFTLGNSMEVFSGASLGISLYPNDALDATQLVRNADAALYQAKSQGRNTYCFYTEALTREANARLRLESRLRRALERDEFELYYQPVVATASGQLIGAEALLRWRTARGRLMLPGEFIPLAEETGLIRPIGDWMLREACRQFRAWLDEGMPAIRLALNLSARQFEQRELAGRMAEILEETGMPGYLLELEITESAIMVHGEQAETTLAALKRLGLSLAIDDFGTGYSSLSYLKRFAVDKLKIDRSFIQDIPQDENDVEIAASIIAMAKNLKLQVQAEGVENEAQLAFLQIHACDAWQGNHYSPPLPAAAFRTFWLENRPVS